jgi:ferredoxin-NADP reductase
MKHIDSFLNNITMYRLVLYFLIFLYLMAFGLSGLRILPFTPISLLESGIILTAVSWITNLIFAKIFAANTNIESVYITALILVLIISPAKTGTDFGFLIWAGFLSQASKYLLTIGKKHLFNPVAIAVVITSLVMKQSASWWIGTLSLFPFVLIGGGLIVRKIRRGDMLFAFFAMFLATLLLTNASTNNNIITLGKQTLFDSPLLFFAFIMFTEPLTTPPTRMLQTLYGVLVGFLFSPQIHLGHFYTTPEIALIIGNLFVYIVSPKIKLVLSLKDKIRLSADVYDFIFPLPKPIQFTPGQYMEWTLPHPHPDERGNRRYFTIASSPTEKNIRLGIKVNPHSSSFKKNLLESKNVQIVASQLSGDFTLPQKSPDQKYVFIAGGIGITPFRSMIKYLADTKKQRDIVLFYANRHAGDIIYRDVWENSGKAVGLRVVYIVSDKSDAPKDYQGKFGHIDADLIRQEVTDYRSRIFYISGPNSLVETFKKILKDMGIPNNHIITDYFPGL